MILNGILFYGAGVVLKDQFNMPFFKADGTLIILLLHWGPAEFLYYWLHRALHHHYLYARYHSHHHSSIVTEPNTCKPLSLLCLYTSITTLSTYYCFGLGSVCPPNGRSACVLWAPFDSNVAIGIYRKS